MHLLSLTTAFTATIALARAQVFFNTTSSEFFCPPGKTAFCAGTSLETNIIIRCNGTFGQPGNCNDNLAGVPPFGVKFAHCYECSQTAGNAACSYNNIVYPDGGSSLTVAEANAQCNSTNTTVPSSLPISSANISSTLSYVTSASAPVTYRSVSYQNGNAIPIGGAAPLTTTVTSYLTAEVGYAGLTAATIASGSGGYNASGTGGIAPATATPLASTSPIEPFMGAAYKYRAPLTVAGILAVAVAIMADLF